jgi:hypothetical protein
VVVSARRPWLVAALGVLASACAAGPRFRADHPIAAKGDDPSGDLSVEVTGLDNAVEQGEVVLEGRVSAPAGVAVRAATLTDPRRAAPCQWPRHPASEIALDGAAAWGRPVAVAGQHALRLDFPRTIGLASLADRPLALDIESERDGAVRCLRVSIQGEGSGATWVPTSPWVVGWRLSSPPLALGVRGGRWLGRSPFIAGLEGQLGTRRGTAALVASASLSPGFGLEASYLAGWARPGGTAPAGTFSHGPRLGVLLGQSVPLRYDRIVLAGFLLEVTRWWRSDGAAASTEFSFGLGGWFSVSTF